MIVLLGLLHACVPRTLADTHVQGGTREEREVVREVLAQFEAEVFAPPTVKRIVFDSDAEVLGDNQGVYTDDLIILREGIGESLVLDVRHELCHAMDEDLGWPSKMAGWDEDPDGEGPKEVFARLCSLGEEGLSLLHGAGLPCLESALVAPFEDISALFKSPEWTGETVHAPAFRVDPPTGGLHVRGIPGWVGDDLLEVRFGVWGSDEILDAWYDWPSRVWIDRRPEGTAQFVEGRWHGPAWGRQADFTTVGGEVQLRRLNTAGIPVSVVTLGPGGTTLVGECSWNAGIFSLEHTLFLTFMNGDLVGYDLTDLLTESD